MNGPSLRDIIDTTLFNLRWYRSLDALEKPWARLYVESVVKQMAEYP